MIYEKKIFSFYDLNLHIAISDRINILTGDLPINVFYNGALATNRYYDDVTQLLSKCQFHA